MNFQNDDLVISAKNLRIGKNSDSRKILAQYQSLISDSVNEEVLKSLTLSKNVLLANIIRERCKRDRTQKFDLGLPTDIEDVCPRCEGRGFFPVFKIEVLKTICKKCDGHGILSIECKTCFGKGVIFAENGHQWVEKKCPTCKGSKKYRFVKNLKREQEVRCPACKGVGYNESVRQTSHLKSFKQCKSCHGTGLSSGIKLINKSKTGTRIEEIVSQDVKAKLQKIVSP